MDDRQNLLLEQWRKASELHRHEDGLAWEKVKYFLSFNSVLLAVATFFTDYSHRYVNQRFVGIGLAIFGALVSLIWVLVQKRGLLYHRYRTAQARQAESDLKVDGQQVLNLYEGIDKQSIINIHCIWKCPLLSIHSLLVKVAELVFIFWLFLLGYFLFAF